jgi:signal transduction histidine kinase
MLDPVQMGQAVVNIVRNGLEAMSSEGKLMLRTMVVDGAIRLEIEDTGVGIPEENLSKLFSEFFTTKSAGVGLGLMVAYQTVKNHRGSIEVKSEEGKGSVFIIDLPIEKDIED